LLLLPKFALAASKPPAACSELGGCQPSALSVLILTDARALGAPIAVSGPAVPDRLPLPSGGGRFASQPSSNFDGRTGLSSLFSSMVYTCPLKSWWTGCSLDNIRHFKMGSPGAYH
jgi:hypothetical protein